MAGFANDATSFFSALASRGVAAVHHAVDDVKNRAAERQRQLRVNRERFEEAARRFPGLVAVALDSYSRNFSQADIDALWSDMPWDMAPVLEAEIYRIDSMASGLLRDAGFDTSVKDKHLLKRMKSIYNDAIKLFQQKAFVGLRLPLFFSFEVGLLGFERVRLEYPGYGQEGYYGVQSRRCYSGIPVLARR